MNKNFYIFRHGIAILEGLEYGDTILTAELLPEATEPIEKIAHFLKNVPDSFNLSSELLRCRQTVMIISKITGKQFVFDKRLNEYYQETFEELKSRIENLLNDIEKRDDKNIIICTHGSIIAGLIHLITEKRFTEELRHDFSLPGELVIIKDKSVTKKSFNV